MSDRMSLPDALAPVRTARGNGDVVITTMGPVREWMAAGPLHELDLAFIPSSMGHATSFGLGIALAQPERRVIVCNGDGSMLMNLGSLVTIATAAPSNLVVIVFDNGVFEVTGAQPTVGSAVAREHSGRERVDFAAIAMGSGFRSVHRFANLGAWAAAAPDVLGGAGPAFVWLEVEPVRGRPAPRSPGYAPERAARLRAALCDT